MNKRYDVPSCALNLSNFANDDGGFIAAVSVLHLIVFLQFFVFFPFLLLLLL